MKKDKTKLNLNRRNFLTGTATLAGIAATASVVPITIANANHSEGKKGLPDFISWKDRDALIVHSDKGIETHRSAIGESLITPNRNIYIRNNMPTMTDKQIGDRKKWKVSIEGVKNPQTFTLAQLQKLGHETMATILQCSGNGRGFFEHKPRGSQWKTGAAACIFWTGVSPSRGFTAVNSTSYLLYLAILKGFFWKIRFLTLFTFLNLVTKNFLS